MILHSWYYTLDITHISIITPLIFYTLDILHPWYNIITSLIYYTLDILHPWHITPLILILHTWYYTLHFTLFMILHSWYYTLDITPLILHGATITKFHSFNLKVLLTSDDAEVRKIIHAANVVMESLWVVQNVQSWDEFRRHFQVQTSSANYTGTVYLYSFVT